MKKMLIIFVTIFIIGCAAGKEAVFTSARVMATGSTKVIFLDNEGLTVELFTTEPALERFRSDLRKAETEGLRVTIAIDRFEKLDHGYSGYISRIEFKKT